jgi:hypothetical protein
MDHSSGLALEWDERAALERPSEVSSLFIVNGSGSMWECDGDEFWAFVSVFDARSGERLPSHGVWIGGAGRTYRLLPGERIAVPAAFLTDFGDLPSGSYELEATISELSLRSPRVSIEI